MTASTNELGDLHKALAIEITERVKGYDEVREGGTVRVRCSAAELAVAVTLLKNNNITASASDNAELAALSKALGERRKKKLNPAALSEAVSVFESIGGMGGFTQ